MQSSDDMVLCKLIDDKIEIGDCVICSDVASGMLKANCIEEKYRKKDNWRTICKECKYHNM
jgi:hypothetical protein